jgi:hypothetical protein
MHPRVRLCGTMSAKQHTHGRQTRAICSLAPRRGASLSVLQLRPEWGGRASNSIATATKVRGRSRFRMLRRCKPKRHARKVEDSPNDTTSCRYRQQTPGLVVSKH